MMLLKRQRKMREEKMGQMCVGDCRTTPKRVVIPNVSPTFNVSTVLVMSQNIPGTNSRIPVRVFKKVPNLQHRLSRNLLPPKHSHDPQR